MNTIEIIKVLASWADGKGCGVLHYTETDSNDTDFFKNYFGSKMRPMLRTGQYLWSYTDLGVTATDVIKDDNSNKIYLYRLTEELDEVDGKLLELETAKEANLYTRVKVERIRQDIDIMRGVE